MTKKEELQKLADRCKEDFWSFLRTVTPEYYYGDIHHRMAEFMTRPDAKDHQLMLIPRDHLKSHIMACWTVWYITNYPAKCVAYVTGTKDLAGKQLNKMKKILLSPIYQQLYPNMINKQESKRERWTTEEISVDHPDRKKFLVREATISIMSRKTSNTGSHFDVLVFDDLVTQENYNSEVERNNTADVYAFFSSIASVGCIVKMVGTIYHPKDLYNSIINTKYEVYDENNEATGEEEYLYETIIEQVEKDGVFLWGKNKDHPNGWRAWDAQTLAKKRAQYAAHGKIEQFYCQYYNDPQRGAETGVTEDIFNYYRRDMLKCKHGVWSYNNKPLRIYAAGDFAYTVNRRSDYSALVVIGIDCDGKYYVLHLDRFKTDNEGEFVKKIINIYETYRFVKFFTESVGAQTFFIKTIKDLISDEGYANISISPVKFAGAKLMAKEERIGEILNGRYKAGLIYHDRTNPLTVLLEEEIKTYKPAHDDLKDALATAIGNSIAPPKQILYDDKKTSINYDPLFGGVN